MLYNFSEIFSSTIGAGGLFDFNATLPFLALEFSVLTFVLNIILYNPLLNIIRERNDYILSNLTQAATLVNETNEIKKKYEAEISEARKMAQVEVIFSQKKYKEIFDSLAQNAQAQFNCIVVDFDSLLSVNKETALRKLKDELQIEQIGTLIEQKIISGK